MQHTSIPIEMSCEIIDVTPVNPLISKCQIKVCYVSDEPNRNNSVITKEVGRKLANSLPGSPIVGYIPEGSEDFEGHNKELYIENGELKFKSMTRPYGFVSMDARCWFQKYLDDGTDEREYLVTEGYLWTGQYPECQRVIDKGNGQSMELDDNQKNLDAYWSKDENGALQFFIINDALISKLCILGEDCEPCFEGANITAPTFNFTLEDSFKNTITDFMCQIQKALDEGGNIVAEENVMTVIEPEDNALDTTITVTEDEVAYTLEDIPEYVELQENYTSLQNSYSELTQQVETMTETLNQLQEFKKAAEKKDKLAKIGEFYMLSEADKKDVVENIDTYSLEDIENKLAVICFRNKVSYSETTDTPAAEEDVTTYNFNDTMNNDTTPAWVRALSSTQQTM